MGGDRWLELEPKGRCVSQISDDWSRAATHAPKGLNEDGAHHFFTGVHGHTNRRETLLHFSFL